jgi:hypothetical protein
MWQKAGQDRLTLSAEVPALLEVLLRYSNRSGSFVTRLSME